MMQSTPEAREKIYDLIDKAHVAMLGTYDENGTCHSRPMVPIHNSDDDDLWFFSNAGTRKLGEIQSDPRVTLDVSDASHSNYVSVLGKAEECTDQSKVEQLWREPFRTWFPKGKEDPNIRLIRFKPELAEYWDSNSSKLIYTYGYMKALVTGEPPKPGDQGVVQMEK